MMDPAIAEHYGISESVQEGEDVAVLPVAATVDQPSKFPTPKVAAFGGVSLVLYQFFDVLREVWQVNIVPSARELIATIFGGAAAWFTKELRERRK